MSKRVGAIAVVVRRSGSRGASTSTTSASSRRTRAGSWRRWPGAGSCAGGRRSTVARERTGGRSTSRCARSG